MNPTPQTGDKLRATGGRYVLLRASTVAEDRCKSIAEERRCSFSEAFEHLRREDPEAAAAVLSHYGKRGTSATVAAEATSDTSAKLHAEAEALIRSGKAANYDAAYSALRLSQPEVFKAATAYMQLGKR